MLTSLSFEGLQRYIPEELIKDGFGDIVQRTDYDKKMTLTSEEVMLLIFYAYRKS